MLAILPLAVEGGEPVKRLADELLNRGDHFRVRGQSEQRPATLEIPLQPTAFLHDNLNVRPGAKSRRQNHGVNSDLRVHPGTDWASRRVSRDSGRRLEQVGFEPTISPVQ